MYKFLTKKTITLILAILVTVSIVVFFTSKGNSEEAFEKGNQLFEAQQYQQAIESFNEAIKINPQYVDAYIYKGVALERLGKYQEAIESYNEAIKINPQYATAYYNKGLALVNLGKYQEAIESYNEAIKINPQHAYAYNNKGLALVNLGKYQEAIESYNEAIKINPQDADAYYNKGVTLVNLGKYQEAIESYNEAIKINPQDADAYNNKGVTLRKLGRDKEADEAFAESKRIDDIKSSEVDDSKNHLNPAPLGIKLNIVTLKDVAKKYKVVSTTSHYLKGYSSHDLDFKGIDIDTISSAGVITNEDQVVVLLAMVLHKDKFGELYDTLKSKYKLIKSQLPFVGNKHAEFEAGNCLVVIDSPHLGFKTSVSYLTKEFRKKARESIEKENQAKDKKNQDTF